MDGWMDGCVGGGCVGVGGWVGVRVGSQVANFSLVWSVWPSQVDPLVMSAPQPGGPSY